MGHFLDNLEVSTRAYNVLKRLEVTDIDSLMALTKERVMSQPNVGSRTWNELAAVMDYYEPPTIEEILQSLKERVDNYNRFMKHLNINYKGAVENTLVRVNSEGYLELYHKDK